jgi:O-antigen ligase
MVWTDVTNHYIGAAVTKGLPGIIALCGLLVVSILLPVRLYKLTKDPVVRSWCWAMVSIIAMLIISFNACTLFGQTATLFYCIVGMIGSSGNLMIEPLYTRKNTRIHQSQFTSERRHLLIKEMSRNA